LQDLQTSNGVALSYAYVAPGDGRRQDVGHAYLKPLLEDGKHHNLHVLVESQVIKVLFKESRQASGVVFRPNPRYQTDKGQEQTLRARKLVVLSAGALGTPSILERSGIGNAEVLTRAGIQASHSLSGVGRDYQDHQLLLCYYKSGASPDDTLDSVYNGSRNVSELIANNDKILGWNGFDASAKIRPTEAEIRSLGREFQMAWNEDFESISDRPLASVLFYSGYAQDSLVTKKM
jgi:alcohol oxidase